jgi:bifunctional non-homologous end joining protein LigD
VSDIGRQAQDGHYVAPAVIRPAEAVADAGPSIVIRADFAGWTGDGLVRQASYKGLDRGKDPRAVAREVADAERR